MPVSEKVAFVFGGSRGIGAASVSRLAQDGCAVAFTYASREDKAAQLSDGIVAGGGWALPIKADSANPDEILAAIAQAVEQYGQIAAFLRAHRHVFHRPPMPPLQDSLFIDPVPLREARDRSLRWL